MTDSALLGAQLYGRLGQLLAPPGSLDGSAGPGGAGNVLLIEPCGKDLDPADFSTDPDVAGAEAFADLVNPVPVPGSTFVDSSRRLDDVAEMVLLNAATDSTASLAAATLVQRARADLELMARGSVTAGDLYHPAVPDPQRWWDDTTPWATASFTIGSTAPPPPPPPPEVLVVAAPPLLWTTCPTVDDGTGLATRLAATGTLSLSRLSTERVLRVPATRRGALLTRSAGQHGALLARLGRRDPGGIADVRVGEVADTDGQPRGRIRYRDLVLAQRDLVLAAPTVPAAPPPSGFELSFSYRVVGIDRPWWHPELFSQPGWTMPGFAPGAVSTGTATGNPGLLGAVTTRMLLVRDLVIRGSWSTADAGTAAAAQQEFGTLGLGPFSLTGEVGWDGTSLTRPGLQVVAWLGAVTPQFPVA